MPDKKFYASQRINMNTRSLLATLNLAFERKNLTGLYGNLRQNICGVAPVPEKGKPTVTAAELFILSPDYEAFKESLVRLRGNFPFEVADMIDLGKAYFKKYPDNFNRSKAEEIHIGYRTARICLIEKMIEDIPQYRKHYYRKMYYKPAEIDSITEYIIRKYGRKIIHDDFLLISAGLDTQYSKICDIPKSMIKERYAGGISIFFNIAYLLERAIRKHVEPLM